MTIDGTYPIKLSLNGNLILSPNQDSKKHELEHAKLGDKSHKYYRKELNHFLGPDGIVGAYDLIASALMLFFAKGAAPFTNFFISLAEYMQVFIARTKIFGNPDANTKEGEIARQRRVGAMAWTQVFAGFGGFAAFLTEMFKNEEPEDLSFFKKTGLSLSILASAGALFTTYAEKMIVIATSKGKKVGNEISGIFLDANNDLRAVAEYLVMAIYPWVRHIRPIKRTIDLLVPILALRDGLGNFTADGINKVFVKKPSKHLPNGLKRFLKKLFFINGEYENPAKYVGLPNMLCGEWFLGKNGLRSKYAPIYKALQCKNFPEIKLENNGHGKLLLVNSGQ